MRRAQVVNFERMIWLEIRGVPKVSRVRAWVKASVMQTRARPRLVVARPMRSGLKSVG